MKNFNKVAIIASISMSLTKEFIELLDEEMAMPNIPVKTMGGRELWITLCERNGWKLQQNMVTHHARILNDENVRIAWGTVNGMYRVWDRLVESGNM